MSGGQLFFAAVMALYAFYIVRWLFRKVAPPVRVVSERARRAKRVFDASIKATRAKAVSRLDDVVLNENVQTFFDAPEPSLSPSHYDESAVLRAITNRIRSKARKRGSFNSYD